MSTEDRKQQQRAASLQRANEIRARRVELRRLIYNGKADVTTAIADPAFANAYLVDVLQYRKRYSRYLAANVLDRLGISFMTLCGQTTPRQRALIARWLRASEQDRRVIEHEERVFWEDLAA